MFSSILVFLKAIDSINSFRKSPLGGLWDNQDQEDAYPLNMWTLLNASKNLENANMFCENHPFKKLRPLNALGIWHKSGCCLTSDNRNKRLFHHGNDEFRMTLLVGTRESWLLEGTNICFSSPVHYIIHVTGSTVLLPVPIVRSNRLEFRMQLAITMGQQTESQQLIMIMATIQTMVIWLGLSCVFIIFFQAYKRDDWLR